MALTTENGKLLLTVLDTNGGGSMEKIETVLELQASGTRKTVKCYDYNNWEIFENEADDRDTDWYARGTTQFSMLKPLPLENCKDNVVVSGNIGM